MITALAVAVLAVSVYDFIKEQRWK